jgi:hypothetical protein
MFVWGRFRYDVVAVLALLAAIDILILRGEPQALKRIVALEKLQLLRGEKGDRDARVSPYSICDGAPSDDTGVMEALITPEGVPPIAYFWPL